MEMTAQNTSKPAEQPVFHKVAENLYRLESSGGYYALIKKGGKQFRRSLKTKGASHLGGVFLGFNFLVARSKGPNWARWMAKATHSSVRWRNALNAATRAVTSLSEPARTKRQVNLP